MPVKTKNASTSRSKKEDEPVVRLGIMGAGEIADKAVEVTLNEAVAGIDGTPHFVVPVTKDLFTDGVKAVVDVLMEQDIPFDAVSNAAASKIRSLKPYISNAAKVLNRERGFNKYFVTAIGDDGKLLALFDPDDEVLDEVMQAAFAVDMPVLAFNQGLDELEAADDDEGDDTEEETDEDESEEEEEDTKDEKPRRSRAAKAETNGEGKLAKEVLRTLGQALLDAAAEL